MQRYPFVLVIATCGGFGCGGDLTAGDAVPGRANLLHGPSSISAVPRRVGDAQIVDGKWQVSADRGEATLLGLGFFGEQPGTDQEVPLVDCTLTWTRSDPALQQLLSCPFAVPAGRYIGMSIGVKTTFRVLIDDAVNGLFTSGGGLVATAPVGGASYVDYLVPGPGGSGDRLDFHTYFAAPLEVVEGTTVDVQIVVDMTHTMQVDVGGGTAAFAADKRVPMFIYGSAGPIAKVAFYTDLGTASNTLETPNSSSNTMRLFYSSANEPAFAWSGMATAGCQDGNQPSNAWNISASAAPVLDNGPVAGGNLARDPTGKICFALPSGDWSATAGSVIVMPEATTVGATSTVTCQTGKPIPAPTSGSNYAAGCPAIATDGSATLTLVAK